MVAIQNSPNGATFAVRVHSRAKKNAITGEVGDALKLALTVPPVDGKANEACIDFFAKLLNLPRSSVTIAAGQTSRNKVIHVAGVTARKYANGSAIDFDCVMANRGRGRPRHINPSGATY
jgi:uncharacterized protein (TIGR00251 family)